MCSMLLARQEQQKKKSLGTFVSADEDSSVQWQTEILQNRVEDLETVLAEKNTEIDSLYEETKDLKGKLTDALLRLTEYEGGGSSSKRPRE